MRFKEKLSESSKRWLSRQHSDVFVSRAKQNGYRARSAFKLIEIDEKFGFLRDAQCIIDLGAAPGGWSQVISERIDLGQCSAKKVIGVDLLDFKPIKHVVNVKGDFSELDTQALIVNMLGQKADLVISDMAPSTTGNRQLDHLRIMSLLDDVFCFLVNVLALHGNFVAKIFQGGGEREYVDRLKVHFNKVVYFKPKASRSESVEIYVVAIDKKTK